MNIKFNKIILKNFGSYGDAEVTLSNKGYCLVTGENHFKHDNAASNGTGKSFLWSGICYALTGETIQGVSSNLKNINVEDNNCAVTLDFDVDNDHYLITRIHKPKSDLKIELNGRDISGKGIKESEAILEAQLPDINKNLIASTCILGQGMPNKFSSFSPSGRKELLEKLTKSDFMIEEIKTRIATRLDTLNTQKRTYEDTNLTDNYQLNQANSIIARVANELETSEKPDFDGMLNSLEANKASSEAEFNKVKAIISDLETKVTEVNNKLLTETKAKSDALTQLNESFTNATKDLNTDIISLSTQIKTIERDLDKIKANPEICPTCGQKMPNADHIIAEKARMTAEIAELKEKLQTLQATLTEKTKQKQVYSNEIDQEFDAKIADIRAQNTKNQQELTVNRGTLDTYIRQINQYNAQAASVKANRDNYDKHIEDLKATKAANEQEIIRLTKKLEDTTVNLTNTDLKLGIVKKMETLAKRDFRGFLLTDIIAYLARKAKEYCQVVFKTDLLDIIINGNNLDITYCNKPLENLSGGERQKVDLILQFAIRDLLSRYFNYSSNILVLDEITDYLDKVSCDAVMDLISTKLNNVDSIFIISHHSDELGIPIDTTLKVIKNESGVSTVIGG